MDRTALFNLTFFTSPAFLNIRFGDSLADNSHIIQIRFYTVIWTSANCDLEFVWEYHIVIAYIKTLVDLLAECKGINQTILEGRSLA